MLPRVFRSLINKNKNLSNSFQNRRYAEVKEIKTEVKEFKKEVNQLRELIVIIGVKVGALQETFLDKYKKNEQEASGNNTPSSP